MKYFRISGDLGDIIYSLPTVKALGGGVLYLDISRPDIKFNLAGYNAIKPLLEYQPYIHSAPLYNGEEFDYDLDIFRYSNNISHTNLALAHAITWALPHEIINKQWLKVPKVEIKQKVLVNKTPRYLNPNIDWCEFLDDHWDNIAFVGIISEYEAFCKEFREIPWIRTKNFLDLAVAINSCDLFIGNCSSPYAIAEGLKKNCIQVVDPSCPSCIFERENVIYKI